MARQVTTPDGVVLTLDASQDNAVTVCLAAVANPGFEATLAGAAGTGKSTVMAVLLKAWKGGILFMAPTGKAANRLQETTGRPVKTIHASIYRTVEEIEADGSRREQLAFGEPDVPKGCGSRTLVVVDEASMVNEHLANTLRKVVFSVGGRILWVGDHEQLPPVEGKWGARLDQPTAKLETVHRQALESAVLDLATRIREERARTFDRWGDDVKRIPNATVEQAVAWAEEMRAVNLLASWAPEEERVAAQSTRVLLTWTNKVRVLANRLTRKVREYPREQVVAGETLICTFNNHDLGRMNGELVEVHSVEECEELTEVLGVRVQWVIERDEATGRETKFLVIPSTFDRFHPKKSDRQVHREAGKPLWAATNPRPNRDGTLPENAYQLMARMDWGWDELRMWRDRAKVYSLQATWGYCLTVHKSQGSQWDEVGFISCPSFRGYSDREFKRRLTYTAVTRAAERFTAFVLNVVPDYRRKRPYGGK